MAAPLGRDSLPGRWSYGVCRDGRVFFIDDDTQTTTWLHPRSGDPVNSGHMIRSDLPRGWEEGFTIEGVSFFINHNQRGSTFRHPLTGQMSAESSDFILQEQSQGGCMMSSTTVSEASTTVTSSTVDSTSKGSRSSSGKVHSFGKRHQSIRRNPNAPVVVRGWLYKQDSSGMRLWKRKWFVLADFCLFYYKDSREETVLGSIPLPSYVVSAVGADDHISRKFAFKVSHTGMPSFIYKQSTVVGSQAEHSGMRTYYFSADTQEDMNTWLKAMNEAAKMQNRNEATINRSSNTFGRPNMLSQHAVPQTNHVSANTINTPHLENTRPIHEVLLEPIQHDKVDCCSLRKDSPVADMFEQPSVTLEMDTHLSLPTTSTQSAFQQTDSLSVSAPVSRIPSRAPSRGASTLPSGVCLRNGLVSAPSPILEPNGIAAGTYQRGPNLAPADCQQQLKRRSTLDQVEQWIQVQKADSRGDNTLPRRTPPTQHKFTTLDTYQTPPRTPRQSPPPARLGEYKYAQDRLSHFRLTPEQGASGSNTVLQLYEWQQRHQFRHGSPTAPLYTPAPEYPFGPRPPATVPPSSSAPRIEGQPRCVSVPPSSADHPPPGPPPGTRTLSPTRRPHTPAERLTVRPVEERTVVDLPFTVSPRRSKSQLLKATTLERHSMPSGYITHTVSAPSLHGKTADDTYMQLKKDLEYLDLKVAGTQVLKEAGKPVRVAESDVDVKLSRLCEQDKILKDLELKISSLKEDKDKLERVLDLSRQQMEQYREQLGHSQKIAYQQRLLQEDLVAIRAQISRVSTEMTLAWNEYSRLERSVEQLRAALQTQLNHSAALQKSELKRELWRIEDVLAGLSASKANYRITIDSVQNPERKFVPSMSDLTVPSQSVEVQPPLCTSDFLSTHHSSAVMTVSEDIAPPRPPLPRFYDYGDMPPAVPPLPKEASVIRHTSVRGLKRQSDERRRDRESGQYVANGDAKSELRSYLSEPELPGKIHHNTDTEYQHLQSKASFSEERQSTSVSSYVTLRRGPGNSASRERPHSALDLQLSSSEGLQPRGRMTAEEQLERMKRHQRALVRERKRNLSQGDHSCLSTSTSRRSSSSSRLPSSTSDPPVAVFDLQEHFWVDGHIEEGWNVASGRGQPKAPPTHLREMDLEPVDYDLDISRELSKPQKVPIPERYIESDSEEPPSPEELEKRWQRTERIKNLLARSSVQNLQPCATLDFSELCLVLQQQERIMNVSQVLASEASQKSKLVAGRFHNSSI
ncbi:pleckstrin homology domain-containing family A member 7-like isoform X11 [Takifugu flavidus]|uniref:pleckstrin homology domain-containing family A member 7-like isoform X11 n=1 Tax=Takifugu flavidus TaxID=433684 RepID=UPI0025444BEC|nr:pleckstrin homology domain-containing family A member 7-like isoform X11 [Takifugu flavidus]